MRKHNSNNVAVAADDFKIVCSMKLPAKSDLMVIDVREGSQLRNRITDTEVTTVKVVNMYKKRIRNTITPDKYLDNGISSLQQPHTHTIMRLKTRGEVTDFSIELVNSHGANVYSKDDITTNMTLKVTPMLRPATASVSKNLIAISKTLALSGVKHEIVLARTQKTPAWVKTPADVIVFLLIEKRTNRYLGSKLRHAISKYVGLFGGVEVSHVNLAKTSNPMAYDLTVCVRTETGREIKHKFSVASGDGVVIGVHDRTNRDATATASSDSVWIVKGPKGRTQNQCPKTALAEYVKLYGSRGNISVAENKREGDFLVFSRGCKSFRGTVKEIAPQLEDC